jgi:hypothetical protein
MFCLLDQLDTLALNLPWSNKSTQYLLLGIPFLSVDNIIVICQSVFMGKNGHIHCVEFFFMCLKSC